MRKIVGSLLLVAVVLAVFYAGFLLADVQAPPYGRVKQASDWLRGTGVARQLGFIYHRVLNRWSVGNPPGAWSPRRDRNDPNSRVSLSAEERELISQLQAVGYLDGYEMADRRAGVTVLDPDRAHGGLNLYISGHTPAAFLIDMEGEVLHTWSLAFREAFPDVEILPEGRAGTGYWRRVHLLPNGDLFAIFSDYGLVRLDKESNLLWATTGGFHHDLAVDEQERVYTLERKIEFLERIHPFKPVLVDSVVVLDRNGELLTKFSLLEAFERSSYASLLAKAPEFGNLMHTNTIELLDGMAAKGGTIFAAGRVLVSVREWDVIAVVDLEQEKVVWALTGQWRAQHQPTMLDSGNILLFDNMGLAGLSQVIELDPLSQQIEWSYAGTAEQPFSTLIAGSCQRLPNGNTLITETDTGRAFEVTRTGDIVWEFFNNARAGENDELVANLSEVIRVELEEVAAWLSLAESAGEPSPRPPE